MSARAYWIGVASRAHVRLGAAGGYCQLGHGKNAPVKRLSPGDFIIYYSPREEMDEGEPLRMFTALGQISAREPYLAQMTQGFEAWRRDVRWLTAREAPIAPLIPALSFIPDKTRWGYPFRRGSFKITEADFLLIAAAMGVKSPL